MKGYINDNITINTMCRDVEEVTVYKLNWKTYRIGNSPLPHASSQSPHHLLQSFHPMKNRRTKASDMDGGLENLVLEIKMTI
jgi:hypothetical protein